MKTELTNEEKISKEWKELVESFSLDLRVRGHAGNGTTFQHITYRDNISKLESMGFKVKGRETHNYYGIDYPEGKWDPQELINELNQTVE